MSELWGEKIFLVFLSAVASEVVLIVFLILVLY